MTEPLIIVGSARKQSDTRLYVDFVFNDMSHKIIDLFDYSIAPYSYSTNYPPDDDFLKIVGELLNHKTIVFATPVYWYAMSGLMKTLFDRFTDLITVQKQTGRAFKNKSIFLLAVGGDADLPNGFEQPFKLTADYFALSYKSHLYFSTKHPKTAQENSKLKGIFIDELKRTV